MSGSSTYSRLPSSGGSTYIGSVITEVSLGYVPEYHTWLMFWVLLRRENWVAELEDAAEVDDGYEEEEAGRRVGVVNSMPLRI